MKNNSLVYKKIGRLDMLDPKINLVKRMNKYAFIAITVCCIAGDILNYALRMRGEPFGMYFVWMLTGAVACLIYIYLHELTHALAVLLCKGEFPQIRIEKLVASCGSPTIAFTKPQYFFVASAPFVTFCLILTPLCVFLPAMFFPIPFMPLTYNVFGSVGDLYMIRRVMRLPRHAEVIDSGTELTMYMPETAAR